MAMYVLRLHTDFQGVELCAMMNVARKTEMERRKRASHTEWTPSGRDECRGVEAFSFHREIVEWQWKCITGTRRENIPRSRRKHTEVGGEVEVGWRVLCRCVGDVRWKCVRSTPTAIATCVITERMQLFLGAIERMDSEIGSNEHAHTSIARNSDDKAGSDRRKKGKSKLVGFKLVGSAREVQVKQMTQTRQLRMEQQTKHTNQTLKRTIRQIKR